MTQRLHLLAVLLVGLALGVAITVVGLARAGRLAPEQPAALVALGQMLEAEHRRVDLLVAQDRIPQALEVLEELRAHPWPARVDVGDEGMMLKHDVFGRLVRLRLEHPDVDPVKPPQLLRVVDEGLGEAYQELDVNPFTSRLVALRGEVLEMLDQDDNALSAYEEALEMNRTLLDRELGGAP